MAENQQEPTMRELNRVVEQETFSCINLPAIPNDWSIKTNMVANLPKFYGHSNENPFKHLRNLHVQCDMMKPATVSIERAKLKAFPCSLEGEAQDWFYGLPHNTVNTLAEMSTLFLNKLSGEIPEEITRLKGLMSLNLSHNSLSGRIPKNKVSLTSLESLDLCSNQLIGEIPQSISNLNFLGHLNLSYNKLSGRIPLGTQIQGFNSSCFIGNQLCGKPLTDNCSGYGAVSPPNSKENGNNHDFQIEWFYVIVALGFIVGFWGVVGPLLFNRNWRLTYFRFLQRLEDRIYIWWTSCKSS